MKWVVYLLAGVVGTVLVAVAERAIGYRGPDGWRDTAHRTLLVALGACLGALYASLWAP